MADSYEVEVIQKVREIQPNEIEYWESGELPSDDELVAHWYDKVVEEFESFPIQENAPEYFSKSGKGGFKWNPSNYTYIGGGGGHKTFKDALMGALKNRMNNERSSSVQKNGSLIFNQVSGYYRIKIINDSITTQRNQHLDLIAQKITSSPYGLIDPLTGEEAIIDTEAGDRIAYYFPKGMNDPSLIRYSVLAPKDKEVQLTDTLLESQCYGFVLESFIEMSERERENPKSQRTIFINFMSKGNTDEVFKLFRTNAGFWSNRINEIIRELGALSSEELEQLNDSFEVEEAQFIGNEGLESKVNDISYSTLLGLPLITDDRNLSEWFISNAPKCQGVQEGILFPKSGAGDYIFHITNDPIQVLTKSTNRTWGSESCEKLSSSYSSNGPFSDIEWGNGIGFLYQSKDLINDAGELVVDENTMKVCLGRFMFRWGIGKDSNGNEIGSRIGVEKSVYGRNIGEFYGTKSPTWRLPVSRCVASLLTNEGLWDFNTINTPYVYKGYSDEMGTSNTRINYSRRVFGQSIGDTEIAGGVEDIDYSNPDLYTFQTLRDLIQSTTDERVLVGLAENPMIWSSSRIMSRMNRRFWSIQDSDNRNQVMSMLLSHNHAKYEWIMEHLKVLPQYLVDASSDDILGMYRQIILNPYNDELESFEESFNQIQSIIETEGLLNWESMCLDWMFTPQGSIDIQGANLGIPPTNIPQKYLTRMMDDLMESWGEEVPSLSMCAYYISHTLSLMMQKNIGQENLDKMLDFVLSIYSKAKEDGIIVGVKRRERASSRTFIEKCVGGGKLYFNPVMYFIGYYPNDYDDIGWEQLFASPASQRCNLGFSLRTPMNVVKVLNYLRLTLDKPITSRKLFRFIVGTTLNMEDLKFYFDFMTQLPLNPTKAKFALSFLVFPQQMKINAYKSQPRMLPEGAFSIIGNIVVDSTEDMSLELLGMDWERMGTEPIQFVGSSMGKITNLIFRREIGDNRVKNEEVSYFLPASFCWALISKYGKTYLSDEQNDFYSTGDELTNYIGDLNRFINGLPDEPDLFYAVETIVLDSQLGDIFTPDGDRPYRNLEPEEFSDYDIQTRMSYAIPTIYQMLEGFCSSNNTPDEILERIIQPSTIDSVGYQRMIDYLSSGMGTTFTSLSEQKNRKFSELLQNNEGIKGRLLRWLWNDGNYDHSALMMNPNLVDARIFKEVSKQFPIQVLNNQKLPDRSYKRHMNFVANELFKQMPVEAGHNFDAVANQYRSYMQNDNFFKAFSTTISNLTGGSTNDAQFVRAGRLRWNTGLPTASDGATQFNASMTGSIPEYPQIFEGKPFMMFRSFSYRVENNQAAHDFDFRTYEFNPDKVYQAYKNNLIPAWNPNGEQTKDDWILMVNEGVSLGYRMASNAIIYEANYDTSSPKFRDDLPIHRDAYMLGIENIMTDISLYWECYRETRTAFANSLWNGFTRKDQKSRFINNLKLMRDGTTIKFYFGYDEDGNNYGPKIDLMFDTTDDAEVIDETTGITLGEWKRTFLENLPMIQEGLARGSDLMFIVRNGVQNLEEMWGWNPVENRTLENFGFEDNEPRNQIYVSKDSASIFNYDAVYLVASTNNQPYIEEDVEQIPVADWRLNLTEGQLSLIFKNYTTSEKYSYEETFDFATKIMKYLCEPSTYLVGGSSYVGLRNQRRTIGSSLKRDLALQRERYWDDSPNKNMNGWILSMMQNIFWGVGVSQSQKQYLFDSDEELSEQIIDLLLKISPSEGLTEEEWVGKLNKLLGSQMNDWFKLNVNYVRFKDGLEGSGSTDREIRAGYFNNFIKEKLLVGLLATLYQGYVMYINGMEKLEANDFLLGVVLSRLIFPSWFMGYMNNEIFENLKSRILQFRSQYFKLWLEASEMLRLNQGDGP
jgi:hypothetical protein